MDVLVAQGAKVGSPLSVIEVLSMGGAIRDCRQRRDRLPAPVSPLVDQRPGPVARQDGIPQPSRVGSERRSPRLSPHLTGGAYSNFMEGDEAEAADVAYGSTLARLREVKREYDPDNMFHLNQNIVP